MAAKPSTTAAIPRASMLTVGEIAERLNLTSYTVNGYLREARIPGATKFGGRWRVDAESFEQWYAEQVTPPTAPKFGFSPRSERSKAATRGKASAARQR